VVLQKRIGVKKMNVRNLDHAKGLLRKLEVERKDWINNNIPMAEVDAYYEPKISAIKEKIDSFASAESDDGDTAFRSRNKRFAKAYR
jgi:hypothetical protein